MYCNKCGQENPDGSLYCNKCGSPMNGATPPGPDGAATADAVNQAKIKEKNKWLAVILVLLALAVAVTAYFCFRPTPTRSTKHFFNSVQQEDWDDAGNYYSGLNVIPSPSDELIQKLGANGQNFYGSLLKKICGFDYTINEQTVNGDKATVNVTITTYDFTRALKDFNAYLKDNGWSMFRSLIGTAFNSETTAKDVFQPMYDTILKDLDGLSEKTVQNTADFHLKKTRKGTWKVKALGVKQLDALTGGVYSTVKKDLTSFFDSMINVDWGKFLNSDSPKKSSSGSSDGFHLSDLDIFGLFDNVDLGSLFGNSDSAAAVRLHV